MADEIGAARQDELRLQLVKDFVLNPDSPPGTPIPPDMSRGALLDLPANLKVGRYTLVRQVGMGGMAVVYEAWDTRIQRRVALKILKSVLATPSLIARLYREAQAAGRLKHPNIVAIHEVDSADDGVGGEIHFIVMNYIEGKTLAEVGPTLSIRQRIEIMERVAQAVGYAHMEKVLHRDLKPQNILLESPGSGNPTQMTVYVADFGLAKTEGDENLTTTGMTIGTPQYMAPEQVRGLPRQLGPHTDVWSLGVMLYELLTASVPFTGGTPLEVYRSIVEDEPRPPRKLNPAIHPDIETICLRSLEKDPKRRYSDAGEVAEELRRHLSGEPIKARPVSLATRFWKRMRRRPWVGAIVGIAAVALLVTTWVSLKAKEATRKMGEMQGVMEERSKVEALLKGIITTLDKYDADSPLPTPDEQQQIGHTLEEVGKLHPDSGLWHLTAGRWWLALGKDDLAESHFAKALDGGSPERLAYFYRAFGNINLAMNLWTPEGSHDSEKEKRLGKAALEDLEAFDRFLGTQGDPRLDLARGLILNLRATTSAEYESAALAFEKIGNSGLVQQTFAYEKAGWTYARVGKYDDAVRVYRIANQRTRGTCPLILAGLGEALFVVAYRRFEINQPGEAKELAEEAATYLSQLSQGTPKFRHGVLRILAETQNLLGDCLSLLGDNPLRHYESAVRSSTEALQLDEACSISRVARAIAWNRIAECLFVSRQDPEESYLKAIEDCHEVLQRDPDFFLAWTSLGTIYTNIAEYKKTQKRDAQSEIQKGEEAFTKAIDLRPESAIARTKRALFYKFQRRFKESLSDFEHAIRLDPALAEIWKAEIQSLKGSSEEGDY